MKNLLPVFLLIAFTFELSAQTWCKKADFPGSTRRNTTGFSINGKGYVCLGGNNSSNTSGHFVNLEMYDPAIDAWTSKASFPGTPRRSGIAFTIDSFAYVGLGWNNSTNFSDMYRYNSKTDVWDTITPYPGSTSRELIATSLNGKGYVGGGRNGTSSGYEDEFYEYDPINDQWTQLADFTFGSIGRGISFSNDSSIFIGLGYDGSSFSDELWSYNPTDSIWTQLATFPGADRSDACYFALDNQKVVVGGGSTFNAANNFSDYYEYDIRNDSWSSINGFSAGNRSRGAYFSIGNKGYISTGSDGTDLKDTWEFAPKNYTFLKYDNTICTADTILFDATTANATYLWQDSSTNSNFIARDSGVYWVEINYNNCLRRDSIEINTLPLPPKPLINQVGTNLSISENGFYQWYKDAQIITGETDSVITATSSGLYHCSLTDTNGCSINSDTLSVIITSLEEYNDFGMVVYPNPTKGFLNIQFQDFNTIRSLEIFTVDGKQVYFDNNLGKHQNFQLNLSHLNKGLHLLKLRFNDSNKVMKLMIE